MEIISRVFPRREVKEYDHSRTNSREMTREHNLDKTLMCLVAVIILVVSCGSSLVADGRSIDDDRYLIRVGAVAIEPLGGCRTEFHNHESRFIVQFYEIPDERQLEQLHSSGIVLHSYVGGNAYIARCDGGVGSGLDGLPFVRSTIDIAPEMKRSTVFDTDPILCERIRAEDILRIHLRFYDSVPFERAISILEETGISVDQERYRFGNSLIIEATWSELNSVLEQSEVMWADPALPPTVPSNANAAKRTRVDAVRRKRGFRRADGANAHVGIWDWFPEGTHADLEDRVTPVRVRPGEHFHGLFISGIIAGAGILDPKAMGMAPKTRLYWYSHIDDPWSEMQEAGDTYGISIVNNSWNTMPGWWDSVGENGEGFWTWNGDLWSFGYYHSRAAAADRLVFDSDLLVVFSAGNKRYTSYLGPHFHGNNLNENVDNWTVHEDIHPPNPEFMSIAGAANGKNVLTIGGTTKEDILTGFSSCGPTRDGRIKPDVVATADVYSTIENNRYFSGSGTSASAGVASGAAALLFDYYYRQHRSVISSVMLKNLLIHSARDLGRPGPDYEYGHGIIDAELAARIIRAAVFSDEDLLAGAAPTRRNQDELLSLLVEDELRHGSKRKYSFTVSEGAEELRATLVWHDPPGDNLINDLDIWLRPPKGKKVRPFVLNSGRPRAAALCRRNLVDNVENILVEDPVPGRWMIVVKGSRVPLGPQEYAIIVSAGDGNTPPERKTEGTLTFREFFTTPDSDPNAAQAKSSFQDGDPFCIYASFNVTGNADYGDFFGSVNITVVITDQGRNLVFKMSGESNTFKRRKKDWVIILSGYEIPSGLPPGNYEVEGVLTMHNGYRERAGYQFSVH